MHRLIRDVHAKVQENTLQNVFVLSSDKVQKIQSNSDVETFIDTWGEEFSGNKTVSGKAKESVKSFLEDLKKKLVNSFELSFQVPFIVQPVCEDYSSIAVNFCQVLRKQKFVYGNMKRNFIRSL